MRLAWSTKVFLVAILPVLLAAAVFFLTELRHVREVTIHRLESDLEASVVTYAQLLSKRELESGSLRDNVAKVAKTIGNRVTIIAGDGTVLADSDVANVAEMENHANRPEVVAARKQGTAMRRRYSRTLQRELLYVASSIPDHKAVVRVAQDLTEIEDELSASTRYLWWAATAAVLLGAAGAFLLARGLARPVKELITAAELVERGDLDATVAPAGGDDVARLGETFNRMTTRLRGTLRTAEEEAARLSTILEGMSEGVVAVDPEARVSFLNGAAREILRIGPEEPVEGRGLYELVRDPRLLGLLQSTHAAGGVPVEGEFTLEGPPRRMIQLHAARVGPKNSDTILVLRDMSRLRRLERMRSDFVSNVSHELRTPLASIAAAVETLQDDEARTDPDTGPRFVEMVRRNVSRLEALLDDILALSRFESRPESIDKVRLDLSSVVRAAGEELAERARKGGVALEIHAPDTVSVLGDAEALRRIVDNLILNAVTYTPKAGVAKVSAHAENEVAILRVEDTGIGIPPADLDRIFERFYRVDKARSRSAGGTGLGLAIVKHAVGLHGGSIEVESEPGRGSAFVVKIPLFASEDGEEYSAASETGNVGS